MEIEVLKKLYKINSNIPKLLSGDNEYIPSDKEGWYSLYEKLGMIKRKVAISDIKIDKARFYYDNLISQETIETILEYFDRYQWNSIFVDEEFYIRDGQHRLRVANLLNLKYIDILILNKENV